MNAVQVQQPLFKDLATDLTDQQKAEFYRTLHEAGIGPKDVELARLLRALQLYKAYYESIPGAIQKVAEDIEKIKQEIARLMAESRQTADAGVHLSSRVIEEAEHFTQELKEIHQHVEDALHQSAEALASQMALLLKASIEERVLSPLSSRLAELALSNQAFEDAIARNNKAASILRHSVVQARRTHLGAYALAGLMIVASMVVVSWIWLHRWYEDRIEQERAALVGQVDKNRTLLLELARSNRTLQLIEDPDHPHRKLLVMKEPPMRKSARSHGVIEFQE